MSAVKSLAPLGKAVDYRRRNHALYAALLESNDAWRDWHDASTALIFLDTSQLDVEECWRAHLDCGR